MSFSEVSYAVMSEGGRAITLNVSYPCPLILEQMRVHLLLNRYHLTLVASLCALQPICLNMYKICIYMSLCVLYMFIIHVMQ